MFCPKCGKQISEMSKFCISCGCKLDEYEVEQTTTVKEETVPVNNNANTVAALEANGENEISRLEAEKLRREEAAQNAINRYKRDESIGKIIKKKQRRAMLPLVLLVLIIALAFGGYYAYKNEITVEEMTEIAKHKIERLINFNKPEGTVIGFCEALEKLDYAAMNSYCVENQQEDVEELETEDDMQVFFDYIKELNEEIRFEIVNSEIDGETAKVKVKFEYKDANEIVASTVLEYISEAFSTLFDETEKDYDALLIKIFEEKKATMEPKDTSKTVVFSCEKKEKKWYISEVPVDVADVISANIYSTLESFSDEMGTQTIEQSGSVLDEMGDYEIHDVHLGEEIELATIKMTAVSSEETKSLYDSLLDQKTEAEEGTKYVIYTVKVENIGKSTISFDTNALVLVDGEERSYEVDDATYFYVDNGIAYRDLSPSIPETGLLVYKVPVDCSDYKILVIKANTNDAYAFLAE